MGFVVEEQLLVKMVYFGTPLVVGVVLSSPLEVFGLDSFIKLCHWPLPKLWVLERKSLGVGLLS